MPWETAAPLFSSADFRNVVASKKMLMYWNLIGPVKEGMVGTWCLTRSLLS